MSERTWSQVDDYLSQRLQPEDVELSAVLAANAQAGLPPHDVSPLQGGFLNLLTKAIGARRILEIGTLGGYSTIWMARALPPEGRLISLEADAAHARVARANIARCGLAGRVEVRLGPALQSLSAMPADAPFDLVFIDADKPNNPAYLDEALRLTRPGGLIVADNVVRDGAVANAQSTDPSVMGVRAFFDRLASEPRLEASALQTVGAKGWDGFAIARVV